MNKLVRTRRAAVVGAVTLMASALLPLAPGATPAAQAADPNNNAIAFTHLVKRGLTANQAAGIVGNLMVESGSPINPRAVQVGGPGRGVAQWSAGTRWTTLVNWAKVSKRDPYAVTTQLDFILQEFGTTEALAGRKLRAASSITDATLAFSVYYERCGYCNNARRVTYAKQVYGSYLPLLSKKTPATQAPVSRSFAQRRSIPLGTLGR